MKRLLSRPVGLLWTQGTRTLAALAVAACLLLAYALLGPAGGGPGYAVVLAQDAGTASVTAAGVVISYQGRLIDPATGLPKADGAYPMSFRLYNVESGGSPLWTESRSVSVVRSTFSVLLGDTAVLNLAIFTGQPLWLGVTVSSDPEMSPRLRLAHAPYAIYAEKAESAAVANVADTAITAQSAAAVDDNAITSPKIADGSITGFDIGPNSVDGVRVLDESLTGNDLANNSVSAADIIDNSLTGGDIADGSIGVADLSANARSLRFIDVNVFGAFIEGSAVLDDGFGPNAGLVLQEIANTFGSFAVVFTLPPDFPTGGTLNGRLVYNINQTGCQINLLPNAVSVARVGRNHIVGSTVTTGLTLAATTITVPGTANQSAALPFTFTSPRADTPLQALDTIMINIYRNNFSGSPDSCTQDLRIQGITLTY